jgi:electron-transferring-flavoprotein dehydrogenase
VPVAGGQGRGPGHQHFPGFDGKEILLADDGMTVTGVRTGDKGLDKDGKPKPNFEPGIDLLAKVTVLGEGARGSLMKVLADKLPIRSDRLPEVFETGIKEVIQLPEDHFFTDSPFNDIHTMGFPLDLDTPGGGFVYEMAKNRIALGFLVALGYENPSLDLYDTFMRFKRHPMIQKIIKAARWSNRAPAPFPPAAGFPCRTWPWTAPCSPETAPPCTARRPSRASTWP